MFLHAAAAGATSQNGANDPNSGSNPSSQGGFVIITLVETASHNSSEVATGGTEVR
jgi:hypothetical protein